MSTAAAAATTAAAVDPTVTTFIYIMAAFTIINAIYNSIQIFEDIRRRCHQNDKAVTLEDIMESLQENQSILHGMDKIRRKLLVVEEESAMKFIRLPRIVTGISKNIKTLRKQCNSISNALNDLVQSVNSAHTTPHTTPSRRSLGLALSPLEEVVVSTSEEQSEGSD